MTHHWCHRKKLNKKNEDCDALQKELDKKVQLVGMLTSDKERATAALSAAQERLKRATQAGSAPAPTADAAKVCRGTTMLHAVRASTASC